MPECRNVLTSASEICLLVTESLSTFKSPKIAYFRARMLVTVLLSEVPLASLSRFVSGRLDAEWSNSEES
jgi:hypothetical protein